MGLRDVPRGLDRNLEGFLRDLKNEISKLGGAPNLTRADVQSLIKQTTGASSSSGGDQWLPGTEPSKNDLIIADRLADAAITARKIAEEAIDATKFARGLTPVEIVDSLPTEGNFEGRMVFLTADGKLYRFHNAAWRSEVDVADIQGKIDTAQLAAGAVGSSQLANDLATKIGLIDADASVIGSVTQRIAAEATARSQAVSLEASTRAQAILDEAATRASADGALQTQINTLAAASSGDLGALLAAVQEEQTARIAGDAAEATARETLATQFRGSYTGTDIANVSTGLLYSEKQARTSADSALSSSISALGSTVSNNYNTLNSAITSEQTTRASADTALSNSLIALTSTVSTNNATLTAAVSNEASTRSSADSALSSQISSVSAQAAKTRTYSQSTQPSTGMVTGDLWFDTGNGNKSYRYNGTSWVATDDTRIADNASAITTEATARANADSALSTRIDTVSASTTSNAAAIQTEATTRATADTALSTRVDTVVAQATKTRTYSQTTAPTTGMIVGDLWFDTDDNNKAYRYSGTAWVATDDTRISVNTAAIQTEITTRAAADTALSTAITTLQTSVDGNTASIQTQASSINGLSAQYTIKVDVNGRVAGFGLASTAVNGTPQSDFIVRADRFGVVNSSGATTYTPFAIYTSNYTNPDGSVIPAGIYVNGDMIATGTITANKLAANSIIAGKIAANAVTTGTIQAGAIKADQIDTGAITAAKLGAGSVSTQALAVGMAGNKLQNSNAMNGTDFVWLWKATPNVNDLAIWDDTSGRAPVGGRVFAIHENGINGTAGTAISAVFVFSNPATGGDWPVEAGRYYEVSCKTGGLWCRIAARISWMNANGNVVASTPVNGNTADNNAWNDAEMAGGTSLAAFKTCYSRGQAPVGAVKARVEVLKCTTKSGITDSWAFITNAMFIECPPYASEPAPWSPGGVTLIGPGSIVTTNLITQSSQIGDAVISTANIGYAQITNAKIGLGAVDTLRVGGNAVTTMAPVSSLGGYTNGWIYLPNGAQGLFFLARAGVGEAGGTKPVQANLQIKFNGGEIANGGNSISPGFGGSIVNTAWLGSIGAGNWGFEAYAYKGGGAGTLIQYNVFIVCIALLR